jgi:uncharacterized membrane protein YhfC
MTFEKRDLDRARAVAYGAGESLAAWLRARVREAMT